MSDYLKQYTSHDRAQAQRWRREMRQERWFEATVWVFFAAAMGIVADIGIMASH
jgi:hypothetical protein